MKTWMQDQENVAKLAIGDNLYIIDKEFNNYCWDGNNLRMLETEQSDISNVVTTLRTATGNGNAIIYISVEGNVLTPAKNKNFVDIDYDQSISGQKTFNTTIHSVGIMVQTYDNSSVVCAGGGVRSIADIQNASYSKTEDDALLLLKADKSTTYIKTEYDALLLLKADKTQLIDSYTKGEINYLLNSYADTGVSYTKGEDDALLLLKADKTQLIDSYKTKTNEQLSKNAETTALNDYITLDTSQTINANKTFKNISRFSSTIDGMSTITDVSFVNSGADNTVVLLGAGSTKSISEFGGSIDDSNFMKKTGQTIQVIKGYIRKNMEGVEDEISEDDVDYIIRGEVANQYVTSNSPAVQKILGMKIFTENVMAVAFITPDRTNQQVLLRNRTYKPLSEFRSGSVDDSNSMKKSGQETYPIEENLI
ncbi:MAG: hypothetical protein EZS28_001392 [Streblomastix strix]|uniref:Uncharacterized protein n=1 Tax=Streblomastix strix TaxID=222440 RepID=A0A5J4X774_9EUKA|nr:MAG: hypothetical protein EZS28_001392 [Streblomastix strix]